MIVRSLAVMALFVLCATHADGQSYQYDQRGRLHLVTYSDCSSIQYDYDASGNRTERIVLAGAGDCSGNRRPIAVDDALAMAPGETKLFDLRLAHGGFDADSDPDESDPSVLRITAVTQGNVPTVSGGAEAIVLQSDNEHVRVTAPNTAGTYQFTYTLSDPQGLTDEGQVQLTVTSNGGGDPGGDNTPPRFTSSETVTVAEGFQGVFYTASITDDDDGDEPEYLELAAAYREDFTFDTSTGELSLKPAVPAGRYDIILQVTDNKSPPEDLLLSVTVEAAAPQNRSPEPEDDWDYVISGGARLIDVLANDTDPDGDTLYIAYVSNGSSGSTARIVGGQIEVMPGTSSTDSFTYRVRDRQTGGLEASAAIRITINRHPQLISETYSLLPGETRTLDVLSNDGDPDGQDLRIYGVTGVTGGASASPTEGGGSVSYTAPVAEGTYAFRYWVDDYAGGVSHMESYVKVERPQPVAHNDAYSVAVGRTTNLPVLQNDDDPAGGGLTIIAASGPWDDCEDNLGGGGNNGVEFPVEGICDDLPGVTISPDKKSLDFWSGYGPVGLETSLTYTVRDQNLVMSSAQVDLTLVAAANRPPEWRSGASATQPENDTGTVYTADARDPDYNTVTYSIQSGGDGARFSINSSTGALSFSTAPDYEEPADTDGNNTYVVNLAASDGQLTVNKSVTITVTDQNEAPVWSSGFSATASENSTVTGYTARASDPEGQTITYSIAGGADASRFTINSTTGSLRFNSAPDYEAPTDAGGNNVYNVTLSASDGGRSSNRSVSVTVTDVAEQAPNSCPVARDDSYTVASGATATFSVLSNDSDSDPGDALSLISVGSVSGGGSATKSGNQVVFRATAGPASSTFSYTITDGECSRSATVRVTTNGAVNRPPAPVTVSKVGLTQGLEMWVGISLSGLDPDGDTVMLQSVSGGNRGGSAQLLGGSRPDVIRVWSSASKGQWEDFTYTVSDGVNPPVSATMRVRVDNYAPIANGNSYVFRAGETRTLTDILSNDSDPDGDPLRIDSVYAFSGGGNASIVNNGQAVRYTARSTQGNSSFWLVVMDPAGGYKAQRVDIRVLPPINNCGGNRCD